MNAKKFASVLLFLSFGTSGAVAKWIFPPVEMQGHCYGIFYVTPKYLEMQGEGILCHHLRYKKFHAQW